METKVKMRLGWVQHYEKTGNASLTSRRCGISRPTLRKWVSRYQAEGLAGLLERSHRPKRCPPKKVNAQHLLWIGQLRKRRLGARRIQSELLRLHQVSFSTATIHKVLKQEGYGLRNVLERSQLKATRRPRKGRKRYQKDVPGERVQTVGELVEPWTYARLARSSINLRLLMIARASKLSGFIPIKLRSAP